MDRRAHHGRERAVQDAGDQSEVCRLEQSADVTEARMVPRAASRANDVPLAIEPCFREGGQLDGCRPIPDAPGTFMLEQGFGRYRAGRHEIRFGPDGVPHRYVQLRGAEVRLSGLSVYITGFTPFERTIELEL
ncbi:MAG: hypothetical protein WBC51_01390 [Vicinamibacterales bacterium]